MTHHVTFTPATEAGELAELPPSLLSRLFCHLLVSRLPAEALQETADLLLDVHDFYRPATAPMLLPAAQKCAARVSEVIDRPSFPVAED